MSNVFASNHPLVAHKLTRLRNKNTDPKKFRELVREMAGLLAYEATADLATVERQVETPLATLAGAELREDWLGCQSCGRAWGWWKVSGN